MSAQIQEFKLSLKAILIHVFIGLPFALNLLFGALFDKVVIMAVTKGPTGRPLLASSGSHPWEFWLSVALCAIAVAATWGGVIVDFFRARQNKTLIILGKGAVKTSGPSRR